MALQHVDPDPAAGYHYPYLLHSPESPAVPDPPILVEPTNMPGPTDDFDAHLKEAKRRADTGFGRRLADELGLPFLHPVFPRPRSTPVDWTHYTHQLCRKTMQLEAPPLARPDKQLVAMIDDARTRLADDGYDPDAQVLLNGFSASGTFAHRFSVLHPDRVRAVSAGGLNGMTVLPKTSAVVDRMDERRPLNYPVGVADLQELTDQSFDRDAFRTVHQFLYMGAEDDSDTLRYPDAWTEPEIRATAVLVYGEDIHDERFPYCKQVYADHDIPAIFKEYPDTGHTPEPAFDDVLAFHRRTLDGQDIDTLRTAVGENVTG